jgi:hypothetical protein
MTQPPSASLVNRFYFYYAISPHLFKQHCAIVKPIHSGHRPTFGICYRRFYYRRKYDAAKTLAAFSATVRDETNLDNLTGELLVIVQETMQPEHVSLWLPKMVKNVKG